MPHLSTSPQVGKLLTNLCIVKKTPKSIVCVLRVSHNLTSCLLHLDVLMETTVYATFICTCTVARNFGKVPSHVLNLLFVCVTLRSCLMYQHIAQALWSCSLGGYANMGCG